MREFLKGLELDKETIDTIMAEHGKLITESKEEINSLKEQISQRDKDLEELKKVDAKELEAKIVELEEKNKTLKDESDKQLLETRKGLMIENSLINSKAKNLKAIKGLLDMDKISLEDDNLKGLEEQIKELQKSDSYLFDLEQPTKTVDLGGEYKEPTKNEPTSLSQALHEKYDNK